MLDKAFWNTIIDNNLDTIEITNKNNSFKSEYPVSNIFNWYKNEEAYCISIKEHIICQSCGFNKLEEKFLFPLNSITPQNMQFKSLNDILLTYTEPSSGSSEKCSYLPNKKIKPNSFYLTCKQKIVKDIHNPDILVLYLIYRMRISLM